MLLPVHTPLGGEVIATVGRVVSEDPVALAVPVLLVVLVPALLVVVVVALLVLVEVVPVLLAPELTSGEVASLLIVTGADAVRLPAASTATAFT
jgi:hypothetical protein